MADAKSATQVQANTTYIYVSSTCTLNCMLLNLLMAWYFKGKVYEMYNLNTVFEIMHFLFLRMK